MENTQDLFVSHASSDKQDYVLPLANALTTQGVSFWLDNVEIGWGDNFVLKINEGLRSSRYVLLCLSKNFLLRPWPENEMSSILAIQNSTGKKRALPLILNSKEEILRTYPILSALTYREYDSGIDTLAQELAVITRESTTSDGLLEVIIESVHTGQLCNLKISPQVSVKWLINKAQAGLGLKEEAHTGAFESFRVRWVLVDVQAEYYWDEMPRYEKQGLYAIVKTDEGIKYSFSEYDRVEELRLDHKMVFHLYAIEDIDYPPPAACAAY